MLEKSAFQGKANHSPSEKKGLSWGGEKQTKRERFPEKKNTGEKLITPLIRAGGPMVSIHGGRKSAKKVPKKKRCTAVERGKATQRTMRLGRDGNAGKKTAPKKQDFKKDRRNGKKGGPGKKKSGSWGARLGKKRHKLKGGKQQAK